TSGYTHQRTGDLTTNVLTQGVQTRIFSKPFKLDRDTTLTNYVTLGNIWTNSGNGGVSALASLTADRRLFKSANLQLTYDFTRQPTFITGGGNHRVSASFIANPGNKWSLSVFGSTMLDAPSSSLL